jgi:hypothetical protein
MEKQIENVTNDEFDLLVSKGWVDKDTGKVTAAGKQAIFAGDSNADLFEYRRSGPPAVAVQVGPPNDQFGVCAKCASQTRNGVCQQCGFSGVGP